MTDGTQHPPGTKPREVAHGPTSAGFFDQHVAEWEVLGLPFDPHAYPVRTLLPEKLSEVTDPAMLHQLQGFDTRNTAAVLYEQRLDDLGAGAPEE